MSASKKKLNSPSPAKRRKVTDSGQSTIQSFFVRSSQKPAGASRSTVRGTDSSPSESRPNAEDDAVFARKLAAEDGLDVEAIRALERRWDSKSTPGRKGSSSFAEYRSQPIDVDAEDCVPVDGAYVVAGAGTRESNVASASDPLPTPDMMRCRLVSVGP